MNKEIIHAVSQLLLLICVALLVADLIFQIRWLGGCATAAMAVTMAWKSHWIKKLDLREKTFLPNFGAKTGVGA